MKLEEYGWTYWHNETKRSKNLDSLEEYLDSTLSLVVSIRRNGTHYTNAIRQGDSQTYVIYKTEVLERIFQRNGYKKLIEILVDPIFWPGRPTRPTARASESL